MSAEPARLSAAQWTSVRPRDIYFHTEDKVRLHGWYWSGNRAGAPLMVYLHGASGHVGVFSYYLDAFISQGYPVFMPDYRGFGMSEGENSFQGLMIDAKAIGQQAETIARAGGHQGIIMAGQSLGSAPAVQLAATHDYLGLLLVSPFTSIRDLMPDWAKGLVVNDLNSEALMASVDEPTIFVHGDMDQVIPPHHSLALYDYLQSQKRLVTLKGVGHRPPPKAMSAMFVASYNSFASRSFSALTAAVAHMPEASLDKSVLMAQQPAPK